MPAFTAKAVRSFVYLFEVLANGGGEKQMCRLTVSDADQLIEDVRRALPAAVAAEIKELEESLGQQRVGLSNVTTNIKNLEHQISELRARS